MIIFIWNEIISLFRLNIINLKINLYNVALSILLESENNILIVKLIDLAH